MSSQPLNMTKNSFTEGFSSQSLLSKSWSILELKLQQLSHTLQPYGESIEQSVSKLFHSLPKEVQHSLMSTQGAVQKYYHSLSNTSTQQFLEDVKHLKATPATMTAIALTMALVSHQLGPLGHKATRKSKHKKKKQSKASKANKQIQAILDFVEETYVSQIDEYLENFSDYSREDQEYKYKYLEEMLLVELVKLDNVDVAGNDVLRANRKKVIRFIQEHHKRLDVVKRNLESAKQDGTD